LAKLYYPGFVVDVAGLTGYLRTHAVFWQQRNDCLTKFFPQEVFRYQQCLPYKLVRPQCLHKFSKVAKITLLTCK
jgi:hypothetical protein